MGITLHLVPYQIDVHARDTPSGRNILNTFYLASGINTGGTLPYGSPVPGPALDSTLLTEFKARWVGLIAQLSVHYSTSQYVMRPILGKRFPTTLMPISAVLFGTPTTIRTGAPHNIVGPTVVDVRGVTTPAALNGQWPAVPITPTSLQLTGTSLAGPWSNDGTVQDAEGELEFLYGDQTVLVETNSGGVIGESLPCFATSSVRRLTSGTGRHFRSRFSLSPMAESDQLDGHWTTAQKTAMAAALTAFNGIYPNGGSDVSSGNMIHYVVSKALAMSQPTPFTSKSLWTKAVLSMVQQPNLGSLVSRKPSLTSVIA